MLRVTSKPAASEIKKRRHLADQAVADRQLREERGRLGRTSMPSSTTPMTRPPTMLMSVMMMPAMASPRTNLLAPSIAPKKSACCVISARRRWASRLVDDAGVQVGVDRHLPAGHAVQGKAGGHFADARGALGDHDELDDDDDRRR